MPPFDAPALTARSARSTVCPASCADQQIRHRTAASRNYAVTGGPRRRRRACVTPATRGVGFRSVGELAGVGIGVPARRPACRTDGPSLSSSTLERVEVRQRLATNRSADAEPRAPPTYNDNRAPEPLQHAPEPPASTWAAVGFGARRIARSRKPAVLSHPPRPADPRRGQPRPEWAHRHDVKQQVPTPGVADHRRRLPAEGVENVDDVAAQGGDVERSSKGRRCHTTLLERCDW